MRARLVLITTLCGATVLAVACAPETSSGETTPTDPAGAEPTTSTGTGHSATSSSAVTSAGPTSVRRVFDREAMQASVRRLLEDDYGIARVQRVSCPSGERVVAGSSFPCVVVIDGVQRRVEITVQGDDGRYVVSRPKR